jgi:hypothetical protein
MLAVLETIGSILEVRFGTALEARVRKFPPSLRQNDSPRGWLMKLYGSFLIRCWLIRDEQEEQRTVFDIEHIQQGEHLRVGKPEDAFQWMMRTMETLQPEQTGQVKLAELAESADAQNEERNMEDCP